MDKEKRAKEAFFSRVVVFYLLAVLVVMSLKVQIVDKDRDRAVIESQFSLDVASCRVRETVRRHAQSSDPNPLGQLALDRIHSIVESNVSAGCLFDRPCSLCKHLGRIDRGTALWNGLVSKDREMISGPAARLVQNRARRGFGEDSAKLNLDFGWGQNRRRGYGMLTVE